jgi:outer membrane protein assembly factor BamB
VPALAAVAPFGAPKGQEEGNVPEYGPHTVAPIEFWRRTCLIGEAPLCSACVDDAIAGSMCSAVAQPAIERGDDPEEWEDSWRVERDEKSSWSTPHIWQHDGKTEIVTNASSRIRSYDLDGKLLWELGGASSIAIPTPVSQFGMVYISSGYVQDEVRPVFAVQPGGTIAWSLPQGGPYNTSPLIYGDHYYTLFDRGFFTSHDARTGKEMYGKVRIDPTAGAFTASPWAYNGRIFALSEDGVTFVIQAGPEYRLLGKNSLDETTLATPAIARGSLFIRTASRLYRIRQHKETER